MKDWQERVQFLEENHAGNVKDHWEQSNGSDLWLPEWKVSKQNAALQQRCMKIAVWSDSSEKREE